MNKEELPTMRVRRVCGNCNVALNETTGGDWYECPKCHAIFDWKCEEGESADMFWGDEDEQ